MSKEPGKTRQTRKQLPRTQSKQGKKLVVNDDSSDSHLGRNTEKTLSSQEQEQAIMSDMLRESGKSRTYSEEYQCKPKLQP